MVLCMLLTMVIIEFKYFSVQVFLFIIIIIINIVIKLYAVIIHLETHDMNN